MLHLDLVDTQERVVWPFGVPVGPNSALDIAPLDRVQCVPEFGLWHLGFMLYCIYEKDGKMENVEPEHWGASIWIAEHVIASALPSQLTKEQKDSLAGRVYSLCHVTPCETCREHHNAFVHQFPPQFDTALQAQTWWWKYHNYVNRLLGRHEWSWDQLQKRFPPHGNYFLNTKLPTLAPDTTQHLTYPLVRAYATQPRPQIKVLPGRVPNVIKQTQIRRIVQPVRRNQTQTQQWRSVMKHKSGAGQTVRVVKKSGCSSCKRKAYGN